MDCYASPSFGYRSIDCALTQAEEEHIANLRQHAVKLLCLQMFGAVNWRRHRDGVRRRVQDVIETEMELRDSLVHKEGPLRGPQGAPAHRMLHLNA